MRSFLVLLYGKDTLTYSMGCKLRDYLLTEDNAGWAARSSSVEA